MRSASTWRRNCSTASCTALELLSSADTSGCTLRNESWPCQKAAVAHCRKKGYSKMTKRSSSTIRSLNSCSAIYPRASCGVRPPCSQLQLSSTQACTSRLKSSCLLSFANCRMVPTYPEFVPNSSADSSSSIRHFNEL